MKKSIIIFVCLMVSGIFISSSFAMGKKPVMPVVPYCHTRYPFILVPGVIGFDKLFNIVDYWYGITDGLEADGAVVYTVALTSWQTTEDRGEQLIAFIKALKDKHPEYTKFNVIAHSHGGTTARYAMSKMPECFASLTTVGSAHWGTPAADYVKETMSDMYKPIFYGACNFILGDVISFMSGHGEFYGEQDSEAGIAHVTIEGITSFNNDYPCLGLPTGNSPGTYGADATIPGKPKGDGRGGDGDILFYSWTGDVYQNGKRTSPSTNLDPIDFYIFMTDGMSKGYQNFHSPTDGFIPVSSTHFGQVLCDTYLWNHFDEVNQTMGIIHPDAADPVAVFRQHANRLQKAGL